MRDVAQLAGVGIKTVSRVVNRETHVSHATAARVLAAIEILGYEYNVAAADLRRLAARKQVSPIQAPISALTEAMSSRDRATSDQRKNRSA